MPLMLTTCGLPLALSLMVRVVLDKPFAVGVNVMLIAHRAPAATLVPQVFVCEKLPPTVMLLIANGKLPVFPRFTLATELAPINVGAKTIDVWESVAVCAWAVPTTPRHSKSRTATIPTRFEFRDERSFIDPRVTLEFPGWPRVHICGPTACLKPVCRGS